jgi:hypothetical protein
MKLQCIDCPAYLAIRNRSGKAGLGKGVVPWLGRTREHIAHSGDSNNGNSK